MSRKNERKELRQPDQFVSFWAKVGAQISERRRPILGAVIAGLVVVAGIQVVGSITRRRSAQASRAFAVIEQTAGAQLLANDADAAKFDDGLPHFKTDRERKEAAIKAADAFLAAYPSSRVAPEAQLLRARFLLTLGKPADALSVYKVLASAASLDPKFAFLAQEGLGYAYEATGDLEQAAAAFRALADASAGATGFYRDHALYAQARVAQRKGDREGAAKLYREIMDKFPTSSLREDIGDRLAMLQDK